MGATQRVRPLAWLILVVSAGCDDGSRQDSASIVGTWALGSRYAPAATTGYTEQLTFEPDGKLVMRSMMPMSRSSTASASVSGSWKIERGLLETVVVFEFFGVKETITETTPYELDGNRLWLKGTRKTYWRLSANGE